MHTHPTIDQELLESFVGDALEALESFERMALCLETPVYASALQELFRAAHNLKGAAMCIGLESFVDFIHRIEDLLQIVVSAETAPSHGVATILVSASHRMTGWLQGVAQNPEAVPVLDDILQEIDSITAVLIANAKSSISLSEVSELRRFTQAELDDIMKVYGWHSSSQKMERPAVQPASEGVVSDVSAHIDQGKGGRTRGSSPSLSERSKKTSRLNDTARVSAQKLDELIQLVELLSVQEERRGAMEALPESDAPSFSQSSDAHGKIIKEVQQKVLELRMQPLAGLLQKLEKTALALADAQGKAIRVVVEGGNVQLDKRVIEKLSVPLVHVIRNSVDHGIESLGVRASLGKPREALIKIRAVRDATGVSISVSDDGRGLNNDDILAAAVKKGVVGSGQQLTPEKLKALIFVQGVSTAARLTEVSGRGVGLDVVMHTVQSLGGGVSVSSEPQRGTLITIYLPERQTRSLG